MFLKLTPRVLLVDTRVTNHGFRRGRPTPHQSVLQAGTAVLVDRVGVPRARCACGNPLLPPRSVGRVHYIGIKWTGFKKTHVIERDPHWCTEVQPKPWSCKPPRTKCDPQDVVAKRYAKFFYNVEDCSWSVITEECSTPPCNRVPDKPKDGGPICRVNCAPPPVVPHGKVAQVCDPRTNCAPPPPPTKTTEPQPKTTEPRPKPTTQPTTGYPGCDENPKLPGCPR